MTTQHVLEIESSPLRPEWRFGASEGTAAEKVYDEVIELDLAFGVDLDRCILNTDKFDDYFLRACEIVTQGVIDFHEWKAISKSLRGHRFDLVGTVYAEMDEEACSRVKAILGGGQEYDGVRSEDIQGLLDEMDYARNLENNKGLLMPGAERYVDAIRDGYGFINTFGSEQSQSTKLIALRLTDVAIRITEDKRSKVVQLEEMRAPDGRYEVAVEVGGKKVLLRVRQIIHVDDKDVNHAREEISDGSIQTYVYDKDGAPPEKPIYSDGVVTEHPSLIAQDALARVRRPKRVA